MLFSIITIIKNKPSIYQHRKIFAGYMVRMPYFRVELQKYNADECSCATAVETIPADSWKIYPNPTTGNFNLNVPDNVNKVVITSLVGAKVGEMN